MHANAMTGPGRRAGRREWLGLAVLALPTLLLSLDISVLYLALPHLSADLALSNTETLWVMDIYGFMIAGFLITMGTLGDRIGRRRLLLIGGTAFAVASVLAAYSTSAEMLIATRALLGIAGATLMPSTLALITNMFSDAKQRTVAIGVWASAFSAGVAIGPVVGGAMLELFWWGSVFLLAVPVMVLLVGTAPRLLPEFRDTSAGRPDLPSVALSLAAMLPLIYAIKGIAMDGLTTAPLIALVAGLAFGYIFTRRQRSLPDPLVDLRLLADRSLGGALAIMLLGVTVLGGIYLFVSQYLQLVAGLSPIQAGLWLLPGAIALIAASTAIPSAAQRVHPGHLVAAGLGLMGIGALILTQVPGENGLPVLVAGFVVAYAGVAPLMVLGTDLIVGAAPPDKAGAAASMSETSSELGLALGVAIFGSLGAVVYRDRMGDIVAGLPIEAADGALDNLNGALATSGRLAGDTRDQLVEHARESFTAGLNVVSAVAAGAAAVLAVLAVVLLRPARTAPDATQIDRSETALTSRH